MKRILIVTELYVPGFKGGGPIKTIKNIVDSFEKKYDFLILTSDRDLGDSISYPNIIPNRIISNRSHKILYTSPKKQNLFFFKKYLENEYDAIYINSFFSKFTILILLLVKLRLLKSKKVIVAPRGELASSALKFKKNKKYIYLKLSDFFGLYNKVFFQATSKEELKSINKMINLKGKKTYLVSNLAGVSNDNNSSAKLKDHLSIIYISRIHPIKNLLFIIEILSELTNLNISLDIYGPIEDKKYYEECEKKIHKLPANIVVNYKGSLEQTKVQKTISNYNLFFLPTLGENFGHTIVEALLTLTPVLISDQTPWNEVSNLGAGKAISLKDKESFIDYIKYLSSMDQLEFNLIKQNIEKFVTKHIQDDKETEKYEEMFESNS
ncbi:glycosyltransferase [Planococcus shenhongbingii]|uniref:Glycosyltransferase n=1 Tax=Planococcus shenhongbingii TaxID=3058398 RepID=A0ABT8N9Y0_9BACL|nr:glycosyltransferase [Planococcus sp. N017]MDN7244682.1 glycosyltransferase [Planococcus sp. N017]